MSVSRRGCANDSRNQVVNAILPNGDAMFTGRFDETNQGELLIYRAASFAYQVLQFSKIGMPRPKTADTTVEVHETWPGSRPEQTNPY